MIAHRTGFLSLLVQVGSKVEFTAGYTKTKKFPFNNIPQNHFFCISGIQHPFCLKNRLLYLCLPVVAVVSLFPSFSNTLLLADFDTAEGLRVMRIFSTGTWGSSVSGVLGSP